ncbi:hypothetical protein PLESTB_000814100 [Pleodorina starrii]|uniref:Uncharacterized protein n=1 Tax=Pleodorina starrii TaxID=330485 RepID=A0A9W6BLL7_9CHLO|nr:hypothetical protein PLESTM_000129700 [Pleodorina starrii]GLC54010.1 hypothetical protein PLESTB_000814100 [Pleodorina starrii]GLC64683.1 hypothetical protein PLESTF_000192100 [Pleodorina starrii]
MKMMINGLSSYPRARCVHASATRNVPFSRGHRLRVLAKDDSSKISGNTSDSKSVNADLQLRLKRKTRGEVIAAGARIGLQASQLEQQLDTFESLLPNLPINMEQMRASDWARVVADPDLAAKLVLIKMAFPALNVEVLLSKHPRTLLWSRQKLEANLSEVCKVLHSLPRPEVVLETLPELLDPRQCFSVVATLRKWYTKRDPLEVLQMDPDVIRRAEQWDVPLEPVFFDSATSTWTAAGYSRTKQEDWQVYIEKEIYKRKPQPIDKLDAVVVGGGGSGLGGGVSNGDGGRQGDASAAAAARDAMVVTAAAAAAAAAPSVSCSPSS